MDKRFFAEIAKTEEQEDGTIKVFGFASTPDRDSDGEIITAQAMKDALPDYMKFGAVREMHGASAAGTAIEARVQPDGRTWFGAHVVDPIAVKKVKTKTYKGFSIGGRVLERDEDDPETITAIKLIEVSLVDRPANPEAILTMYKAEDAAGAAKDPAQLAAINALSEIVDKGEITPAKLVELAEAHLAKGKAKDGETDGAEENTDGEDGTDDADTDKAADPIAEMNNIGQGGIADPAGDGEGDADNEDEEEEAQQRKAATIAPGEVAEGLDELAKALEGVEVKKGLRGIQSFAQVIYQLVAVQASIKRESEDEGDNSPVPGKIQAAIEDLLAILVDMAQEETSELVADMAEAGMEAAVPDWGSFAMAAKVVDMAKTAKPEPVTPPVVDASGLAKSELASLLAKCGKLEAQNATLAKRVADLSAEPTAPKGALKVVGKSDDVAKSEISAEDKPPAGSTPEQAAAWEIRKIHASGGSFIKIR